MSSAPPATPPAAPATGGLKQHLPFVVALVAGLAVGGGAGAFVVGPAMAAGIAPAGAAAPRRAAAADADDAEHGGEESADEEEAEGDGEHGEGGEAKATEKPAYTIDNLVLNPAESGGTRFLLLTITFEVKDAAVLDAMKTRDSELRDAVLVALGAKTVEQLSDMTQREALKTELKTVTGKLFKKSAVRRVYFPQFVIQ